MRLPHTTTLAPVVGLGLAVTLAACGGTQPDATTGLVRDSGAPSATSTSTAPASTGYSTAGIPPNLMPVPGPLDAYTLTPAQQAATTYANEVLIAACMRNRGYTYPVPRYTDLLNSMISGSELSKSRLYGLVNLDDARNYGFGTPPAPPNVMPALHLSTAGQHALIGSLKGQEEQALPPDKRGCSNFAFYQLTGITDVGNTNLLTETLGNVLEIQAMLRAEATPQYYAVQQDWGACMKTKGYDIPDPLKPAQSKVYKQILKGRDPSASTPPSKAEAALAVSGIECASQLNLVQRHAAQVNQIQQQLLEQNQLALNEQEKTIQAAITKSMAIVADNGNTPVS